MKRTILAIALLAVSCAKQAPLQTVTFDCGFDKTKSNATDIFEAAKPDVTGMYFYLIEESGSSIAVEFGVPTKLAIGRYGASGTYTYTSLETKRNDYSFGSKPSFKIEDEVEIHAYSQNITVSAVFLSAMLVFPKDCVGKVQYFNGDKYIDVPHIVETEGAYGLFWRVSGNLPQTVQFKVCGKEGTDNLDKIWTFGKNFLPGHWYIVTPESVTETEKPIGIDFPDWIDGNVEE